VPRQIGSSRIAMRSLTHFGTGRDSENFEDVARSF
jgi:hypothetical protein